jgi:hypothetical protein
MSAYLHVEGVQEFVTVSFSLPPTKNMKQNLIHNGKKKNRLKMNEFF